MDTDTNQRQEPACPRVSATADSRTERTGRHTDLVIDDGITAWQPPATIPADSAAFRASIGLPADRPIVMTGHQPAFWHAGILTKYLAADALAARSPDARTTVAWCVPDHVADEPGLTAFPTPAESRSATGDAGRWARAEADLAASDADDTDLHALPPALADAAERMRRLRTTQTDAGDTAEIQIRAHAEILEDRLGLRTPHTIILARDLAMSALFGELLERMQEDPRGCTAAYNAAAAALPDAGVRQLATASSDADTEVPIWGISDAGTRLSLRAGDIAGTPRSRIRPRALLFTGLLRARACDLFIHGTGGGIYDRVTERWLADWLGWSLAPAGVATATLTLDLGVPDVSRKDLDRARWAEHHARHQPGALGDSSELQRAQRRKQELVAAIRGADPGDRAALFAEMHALLDRVRTEHADALAALGARTREVAAGLADRAIARDRTWPWMLHTDTDLSALRADIGARLGADEGSGSDGAVA